MKSLFLVLGLALSLVATNSYAVDIKTINTILQKFGREFKQAKDIRWTNTDELLVIEFKEEEKTRYAYYNQEAELLVLAKPMTVGQLNESLQQELAKKYSAFVVTDVYQLNDKEGIKYSAVAIKGNEKIILSSNGKKWQLMKNRFN
jgi:hypothetical protein